ncbi:cytochrome c oxidase subunit 3 [Acidobacteria bacterium AH-259-D05]|nr:cytochrome c oxidase subunit 3 [Acidobacteria bacterium AH-259-D05]
MAGIASETTVSAWGGGGSPYAIGSKKLGMWLFLVSDSLTFSAFLIAYSYVRVASENWPRPFEASSIFLASVMTFCLLSSSLTMVMAVLEAKQEKRRQTVGWILATMLGGVIFIILHLNEWLGLIHEGVTPFDNPWGVPLFGASFFTLTGLHMTHVTVGVLYLGTIAFGFGKGKFTSEDVEISGLYWHFVDLVWMFIFPMVYLLSNKL